jgi:hypothetical protein
MLLFGWMTALSCIVGVIIWLGDNYSIASCVVIWMDDNADITL